MAAKPPEGSPGQAPKRADSPLSRQQEQDRSGWQGRKDTNAVRQ